MGQDAPAELEEWHMWRKQRGGSGVRRLLLEQRDPIGIREMPEAAGEYDACVGRVDRMLREGAASEASAEYLTQIRTDHMGLDDQPQTVSARDSWLTSYSTGTKRSCGRMRLDRRECRLCQRSHT